MNITRVPLDSLHQDPGNVRTHGPQNMRAIRDSLSHFGQAEPLVVQKQTGRVIGGYGRLAAMLELGWHDCEVVELDLDDQQAKALGVALNRTAELAEWDEPALAQLLAHLRAEDALEGVGYSDEDIDALLAELEGQADAGEVDDPGPEPPPERPTTRVGDLWLLGRQRSATHRCVQGEPLFQGLAVLRWASAFCAKSPELGDLCITGRAVAPRARALVDGD